jgi:LysM repeat protein
MAFRRALLAISLGALLQGCGPQPEGQTDDQKDPFYQVGLKLDKERDYKGAVDAFEKALQNNPRNVLAHYNLGRLYETQISDFATALYHYKKVIAFQPNGYPAEIVQGRIKLCEQEIAKNVALVSVDPSVMNELEKLREENRRLQRDLDTLKTIAAVTVPAYTNPPPATGASSAPPTAGRTPAITNTNQGSTRPGSSRPTDAAGTTGPTPRGGGPASTASTTSPSRIRGIRTQHYVRAHETLSAIARQYGVSLAALRAANPGVSPDRLRPGQSINIPSN